MPSVDFVKPVSPGVYKGRRLSGFWQLWHGWDGRHWSRGYWTRDGALYQCNRWLQSGGYMPREQRQDADNPVVQWAEAGVPG